jgi:hypothetical protein
MAPDMQYRDLGRTGEKVSAHGMAQRREGEQAVSAFTELRNLPGTVTRTGIRACRYSSKTRDGASRSVKFDEITP